MAPRPARAQPQARVWGRLPAHAGGLPCGLGSALRSELSRQRLSVLGFAKYLSSLQVAQETPTIVFLWRPGLRPPFLEVCPRPPTGLRTPVMSWALRRARARPVPCAVDSRPTRRHGGRGSGFGCGGCAATGPSPALLPFLSSCPASLRPALEAPVCGHRGSRPPSTRAPASPGKAHREVGPGQNVLVCSRDSRQAPVLAPRHEAKTGHSVAFHSVRSSRA